MDLNTRKGLAEFFDRRRAEVARQFNLMGKHPRPMAWLVHTREVQIGAKAGRPYGEPVPESTEVLDAPVATDMHCPAWLVGLVGGDDERARRLYIESVREMAKHAHGIAFILISTVELTATDYETGERVEQKQALFCFEETTRERHGYTANITVTADDVRLVGPWVQLSEEAESQLAGMMVGIVPGSPPVRARSSGDHGGFEWRR